jgi:uncharacterized protein YjiS (DUF1127 family)
MTIRHPHPNLLPEGNDRAFDLQVRSQVDRARQLRAEAVAETIVAAYDGLAHALRTWATWLARHRREARARHALAQCSDRTLADIGIRRDQIPLIAKGVLARHAERERDEARANRREQRRVRRELMLYSDEELSDLGIRRRDIPDISRAA